MHQIDIVRAWKDEEYRASLSAEELAALPENPIGMMELGDAELAAASGGHHCTCYCCPTLHTADCCPSQDPNTWDCCPTYDQFCFTQGYSCLGGALVLICE